MPQLCSVRKVRGRAPTLMAESVELYKMSTSMFLALLLDAENIFPLIPQALAAIYKNDENIRLRKFGRFALYISIQDFYRVACSLIHCGRQAGKTFELLPDNVFREPTSDFTLKLLRHPVFGLYCLKDADED